jgi:hypothetical protein
VELGTVISVEHPERVGVNASSPIAGRVMAITVDPLKHKVTLEAELLQEFGFEALP